MVAVVILRVEEVVELVGSFDKIKNRLPNTRKSQEEFSLTPNQGRNRILVELNDESVIIAPFHTILPYCNFRVFSQFLQDATIVSLSSAMVTYRF